MPAISVSIKTDTLYNLERAVKRTGWNKSKIAEEALNRFLSELAEDSEDARIGEESSRRAARKPSLPMRFTKNSNYDQSRIHA